MLISAIIIYYETQRTVTLCITLFLGQTPKQGKWSRNLEVFQLMPMSLPVNIVTHLK